MGPEKRCDVSQWSHVIQFLDRAQYLEFVFDREAVSRFGLDGRGSSAQEPVAISPPRFDQLVEGCGCALRVLLI